MTQWNGIELPEFLSDAVAMDGVGLCAKLKTELSAEAASAVPKCIDGATLLLLNKGCIRLTYNGEPFQAVAPAAIDFSPRSRVAIDADDWSMVDLSLLWIEPGFLPELNISFNAITSEGVFERSSPVMHLSEREFSILQRYLDLIHGVMEDVSNYVITRHILSSLLSSMVYQVVLCWHKRLSEKAVEGSINARRAQYVSNFFKLLHMNFMRKRSLGFYAESLCISPKYLSIMVRESTGRSAAEWIDRFVVAEAKYLLRFSGKPIQQIAFSLNFGTQSAFGKYFKNITGLSPSEFQELKTDNDLTNS